MNYRLYDGTVRCADHFDASSYQGVTSDPCAYCPAGVTLDKIQPNDIRHAPGVNVATPRPLYPLVGHRAGLRANDLVSLASALWIEANERGASEPRYVRHAPVRPQDHFGHTDPSCNCA